MINVRYHARKRPKPDQSPYESIDAGFASCTGLSVLLIDACRSVGVLLALLERQCGQKNEEIIVGSRFGMLRAGNTGACEYSSAGWGMHGLRGCLESN